MQVVHIFYLPLMVATKTIKFSKWKVIFINMLAICSMGFLYHLGRNFYLEYYYDFSTMFLLSLKQSYYFVAVAIVSGFSSYLSETYPKIKTFLQRKPILYLYNFFTLCGICLLAMLLYDFNILKILLLKTFGLL